MFLLAYCIGLVFGVIAFWAINSITENELKQLFKLSLKEVSLLETIIKVQVEMIEMYKWLEKQKDGQVGKLKADIEALKKELMRDEGEALED